APLISPCFQVVIIVAWTPNSDDSSARVFSPDSDAIATRALNSALCCFLFMPTSHVLWTGQPLAYPAVQKSGAAAVFAQPAMQRVMERLGRRLELRSAKAASRCGSRSLAIMASIIRRPLAPIR